MHVETQRYRGRPSARDFYQPCATIFCSARVRVKVGHVYSARRGVCFKNSNPFNSVRLGTCVFSAPVSKARGAPSCRSTQWDITGSAVAAFSPVLGFPPARDDRCLWLWMMPITGVCVNKLWTVRLPQSCYINISNCKGSQQSCWLSDLSALITKTGSSNHVIK